jgi:hypothetical protein
MNKIITIVIYHLFQDFQDSLCGQETLKSMKSIINNTNICKVKADDQR